MNSKIAPTDPIQRARESEYYPLALLQQRSAETILKVPAANNITFAIPIAGKLDSQKLKKSLLEVIKKHSALRSKIENVNNDWRQTPLASIDLNFQTEQINLNAFSNLNSAITSISNEENLYPFDLKKAQTSKFRLICIDDLNYVLFLTFAHSVCDRWSVALIVGDLINFYGSAHSLEKCPSQEPDLQMIDYSCWQKKIIDQFDSKEIASWNQEYASVQSGNIKSTKLISENYDFECLEREIAEKDFSAVVNYSKINAISPFSFMLSQFSKEWSQFSEAERFIISIPFHNRTAPNSQNIVGCVYQNSPVIIDLANNEKFVDQIKSISMSYKKTRESLIPTVLASSMSHKISVNFNLRVVPTDIKHSINRTGGQMPLAEILTSPIQVENNLIFNSHTILNPNSIRRGGNIALNVAHYVYAGKLKILVWYRKCYYEDSKIISDFLERYVLSLKKISD